MSINYTISSKAREVEKSKARTTQSKKPSKSPTRSSAKKRTKSVDGVSRTKRSSKALAPKPKTAVAPPVVSKPTMKDIVHPSSARNAHHATQRSQTLMRSTVRKPEVTKRPHIVAPISHNGAVIKTPVPAKLSVNDIDTKRLQHAQAVPKSKLVTRFSSSSSNYTPMIAAPTLANAPQPLMTPSATPVSHQNDIFTAALHAATSHQEPPVKQHFKKQRKSPARRIFAVSGAALAVVVLLGLVVSQNMTSIRLQLASSKAGFSATIPSHEPSGFGLHKFSAAANEVTAHYTSNSDSDRQFSIIEKPSDWDSATLRDSYVKQITQNYQIVEENGRTIFLYNNDSATWVNGGVWYVISGAHSLSNKQLIDIATSM